MITRRIASSPAGNLARGLWTCPSCTRSSFQQTTKPASIRITNPQQSQQKRRIHHVPILTFDETFQKEGVPGLFSKDGYNIAWNQYQTLLVNKLNELTAGEPIENAQVKDLALQFARDPMNASLFNHASALHNNHLFFQTLSSSPVRLEKCPSLQTSLEKTFGSIETLKFTMLDTAAAMFGPGYVWLVWARNVENSSRLGQWRILTTYLAGTPYAEAGYRAQGIDMASNNADSYAQYMATSQVSNTVGSFGRHSKSGREEAKLPPGGTSVMPVLCVSTWEHTYIYDYGLFAKRKYLDKWWAAVDWGTVQASTPREALEPHATGFSSRPF